MSQLRLGSLPIPGGRDDWLMLLLPLAGILSIQTVGTLYADELLLLALLPLLVKRHGAELRRPMVIVLLIGAGAWLSGLMITDNLVDSISEDYLRGWAKILFFMVDIVAITLLLRRPRQALFWLTGLAMAAAIRPFQTFDAGTSLAVLWKFGLGPAVLVAACLPSLWRLYSEADDPVPLRRLALVHLVFGLACFFFNSRSLAALAIAAGIVLLFYPAFRGRSLRPTLIALALGALVLVGAAVAELYRYGASSGYFGDEAREKFELQASLDRSALSMLLLGRPEILVSTEAIADSPIVGHGSWARDYKYLRLLAATLQELSDDDSDVLASDPNEGLIPTHSYLFGAWVEAGIAGGAFWLLVLALILFRVVPALVRERTVLAVLGIMLLPGLLWDIFYSPFGAYIRVQVASQLVICSLIVAQARRQSTVARRG